VFEVVAEPSRRLILDQLRQEERTVGDLVAALRSSQPAVSKHLRVLREAGLVAYRVEAQRRFYRATPAPLRAIDDWIAPYRAMWSERLDALERRLDEMDNQRDAEMEDEMEDLEDGQ
jgi:DNA-binding transcriptional ArsR family regulator